LADREFVGAHWLEFLDLHKINYHIRIRNNFKVNAANKTKGTKASDLFRNIKLGEFRHYGKKMKMHGVSCYLSAMSYLSDGKPDFLIVVSYSKPEYALEYYKKRWQIETLFKGLKSSGFTIEDTHITNQTYHDRVYLVLPNWRPYRHPDKPSKLKNTEEELSPFLNTAWIISQEYF